jgi:hypothetical protein
MFRLYDAVRRYQAQYHPQPEAGVSPLLYRPCRHALCQRFFVTVAAFATPALNPAHLALLIEQLREKGALPQHQEKALLIRPTASGHALRPLENPAGLSANIQD